MKSLLLNAEDFQKLKLQSRCNIFICNNFIIEVVSLSLHGTTETKDSKKMHTTSQAPSSIASTKTEFMTTCILNNVREDE